jgi:hypothetical protein
MMVMTELNVLNRMIKNSAKVNIESKRGSNKASVTLIESQSPTSKVVISGMPLDAIVIKVDAFKSPDTILTETNSQRKRADYIIVADNNGKKIILHIEIKTTKAREKDIINQLKGSVCFVGYCKEIAKEFWNDKKFLSEFSPWFVCFTHTGSIKKRPTRTEKKHPLNDTPTHMLKVSYSNSYHYNHLVGA